MKSTRNDLLRALGKSAGALAAFEAMPHSHQRRWLDHIGEAKKPETRVRRIAQCVRSLAGAKPKSASTGYSGTPLLQKLGIKAGHRVALLEAPQGLPAELAAMTKQKRLGGRAFDVIVLFATERRDLERRFRAAARSLEPDGGLWVAWPKRAAGVPTDLTEDRVREIALAARLVDNKVCAIDAVWSGLRCVYRLKDRPA